MTVVSKHLGGTLRLVDSEEDTIHSYHNIRPDIQATNVESFLQAVSMLRGQTGGNAYLTITTQLEESSTSA
ncbi:MAG: hypothetical protein FWE11_09180 [Defluviitaleaceae bacterium]|nr:hypothetical protein [Defluviitaleaceae bacterium]